MPSVGGRKSNMFRIWHATGRAQVDGFSKVHKSAIAYYFMAVHNSMLYN